MSGPGATVVVGAGGGGNGGGAGRKKNLRDTQGTWGQGLNR